jgi:hypothetical protein
MRPSANGFFWLQPPLYCGHMWMTADSHCFSEEEDDTPQAPYPRVDWSQPKLSDAYRSSYAECRRNNSSHTQSRRHFTLHSCTSNSNNTWRSRSVLSIIVYTLVSYDTTYLWSSLRSFPILWPCSLPFHCKWSFYIVFKYCLFSIAYDHITYPLPSSHIPSPRVRLTLRLNPFS